MLVAHKLLNQGQILFRMSFPVDPQPKPLQSVTFARTFFYLYGMRASGSKEAKTVAQSIFRDNIKERVQQGQIYMPHTVVLLVSITPWIKERCVNH